MSHRRRTRLALASALTATGFVDAVAWARPGGGGNFHPSSPSPSHASSPSPSHGNSTFPSHPGSSSSGDGTPMGPVGIVIWVVVVLVIFFLVVRKKPTPGWSTATAAPEPEATRSPFGGPPRPSRAIRKELLFGLGKTDPEFSLVLLEDFVYALYAVVHEARGKGTLATLAPYLRPAIVQQLATSPHPLAEVRTVIIGALRFVDVKGLGGAERVELALEFESNYTEVTREGAVEQTYYVRERWTLSRAASAKSRPVERANIIGCPNCGAPLSALRGSTCSYCQKVIDTGDLDWVVDAVVEIEKTPTAPTLTSDNEEAGNSLPTVVDPEAQGRLDSLVRKDPTFAWNHFLERVARIHAELQPAWSTREWTRARPFVSDQLFQMLAYWMETYTRARLHNMNTGTRITRIELAAVINDAHFDALTVRLFASGLDYTETDDGRLVSGSKSKPRAYTEYWTLIRGAGTRTRPIAEGACPNCGAPLSIAMAGTCNNCKAKVTAGEFDWVLSRIEQDEAYSG